MSIQPKNLETKVALLLSDIERCSREEAIRKVQNFVVEQLEWKESTFTLDAYDLSQIKSFAVKEMTDFPIQDMRAFGFDASTGGQDEMRTLSWVLGVLGFFRGQQMVPFKINFKRRK